MRPRGMGVGFSHESIAMSLGVRLCQRIMHLLVFNVSLDLKLIHSAAVREERNRYVVRFLASGLVGLFSTCL